MNVYGPNFWTKDAAKYLKISRNEFVDLVREGYIRYGVHPGGKRQFYPKSELDRYLERCMVSLPCVSAPTSVGGSK